jgi:non-specific serine/threonine protein kinase
MLKRGDRFNESSLASLIKPIAEGLERAHRVGVLHRDIKPPNILVNENGRPVLIDFGSARFESADATSTKVTFHTPPYAAIEQYVKTYAQGPWTDIYALGVVLYECVTGTKPADVLERLHGDHEKGLADGNWPGYSKTFLAAIDAAMTIKPADRPQSIADWLALFDDASASASRGGGIDDEDETRVFTYSGTPEEIVPVAPPIAGFSTTEKPPTNVPDDLKKVRFKLAGQDTGTGRKADTVPDRSATPHSTVPVPKPEAISAVREPAPMPTPATTEEAAPPITAKPRRKLNPFLVGAVGVASIAAAGGSWFMFGGGQPRKIDEGLLQAESPAVIAGTAGTGEGFAVALNTLIADARQSGAPGAVIRQLSEATRPLANAGQLPEGSQAAAGESVRAASAQFAAGLLNEGEARARQLAASVSWANAANANSARREPANRQAIARNLRSSLQALRADAATAESADAPDLALAAARKALTDWRGFAGATRAAYRAESLQASADAEITSSAAVPEGTTDDVVSEASAAPSAASTGVSGGKRAQFSSVVSRAKLLARQMRAISLGSRPGSRATDEEKEAYRTRQADRDAARDYERYLERLESSMRGAKTDSEADQLINQALQTEDYLRVMVNRSGGN